MDELKTTLERVLFLIDEFVPIDAFKNGNEHQGTDEGEVNAKRIINEAKQTLSQYMTFAEKENSPLFSEMKTKG